MSAAMANLTVLCGFWPHATAEAAGQLAGASPGSRVVSCANPGLPHAAPVPLIATAPATCEPDDIRRTWQAQGGAGSLSVVTVVPADLVLDGITDETPLESVGMATGTDDRRSIGEVVCRQIEQADSVVLAGHPDGDDEWEAEQLRVLLRRIAPWSEHLDAVRPPGPGRREPLSPVTRGLRGRTVGVHEPLPDHGVTAAVFRARRPFHPGRLHEALDEITDRVLRSRGHFWLACRPDLAMTWESAGSLRLGPVGGWLAGLPTEYWHTAGAERCLAAEIDWDPYYGDRGNHLAFVGVDLDPVRLHRTLAGCLLTDDELSRGEEVWRQWPDPFARSYPVTTGSETNP